MKRIFEYIGGIPIRLRFDNMTTAVAQVLKDGERVLTEGFTRFMLHCIFRADFCNPASGNEKGNVEKKVGYSRRNASASVPSLPRLRNLINGFGSGTKRTPTGSTTNTRSPQLLSQELAVIYGLETYGPDPAGQVQSTLAQQKGVTTPGYGTHLNGRSRFILNHLKGIFFRDDDLEQMTFSGTGRRGGNRYHDPPHLSFSRSRRLRLGTSLSASDFAIHKDSVIDFYMLPCYNNIILAGPWDMGPWGHQERSLRS